MTNKISDELESSLAGIRAARKRLALMAASAGSSLAPEPLDAVGAPAPGNKEALPTVPALYLNQMIARLTDDVAGQIGDTAARVHAMQQAALKTFHGTATEVIDVEAHPVSGKD